MVEVGVDPVKLRFHKHMVNEMIPYAVLAKLRMQKTSNNWVYNVILLWLGLD